MGVRRCMFNGLLLVQNDNYFCEFQIKIPYKRPRLKPGAVPTIFSTECENDEAQHKTKQWKFISKKSSIALKKKIAERQKQIEEGLILFQMNYT